MIPEGYSQFNLYVGANFPYHQLCPGRKTLIVNCQSKARLDFKRICLFFGSVKWQKRNTMFLDYDCET